jgi:hypothetical protein
MQGPDASASEGLSLPTVQETVRVALIGSANDSKKGQRVFRKHAGTVCRCAREEAGPAGLCWSKAAWEGSLHAAKAGLESLAGAANTSADVGLLDGLKQVLAATKRAHLEGLEQPASRSRQEGGDETARSRASTRPAAGSARTRAAQSTACALGKPVDHGKEMVCL